MSAGADPQTITFDAVDGFTLEGTIYRSADPKIGILISPATGYPRSFYDLIARYLAARGAVVVTYDYRGNGGSGVDDLASSGIDYPDYGRLDTPAAIDLLERSAPGLELTHLAHSVGGHFFGLVPNHEKIKRHAFVSVGTGFWGGHHFKNRFFELFFWWGVGPYSLARYGYINRVGGWQGEPLPPKVFRTWRRWSQRRAYFTMDYDGIMSPQHYEAVSAPIRSWVFPDDPIATDRAAADLLSAYPSAPSEIVKRSPSDIGAKRIGHDGGFRKGREALWGEYWEWLSTAG